MEPVFATNGLMIKKDHDNFLLFHGQNRIDTFVKYEEAFKLLGDLNISLKASSDKLIGTTVTYLTPFDGDKSGIIVARAKVGYVIQPCGSTSEDRFVATPDTLFGLSTEQL